MKGASGDVFESRNPADRDDVLGVFQRGNALDVDRAVEAALAAFPSWSSLPAPKRADYLLRVGLALEREKEELARLMTREMGKTLREARADVQEAIDLAFYIAGEGRRLFGHTVPSELPNKFSMTVRSPVGVCGLITPWNFPIAIPMWKIAPCLVAGNTAVFKPAEDTPLCAVRLVELFQEVGLPPGVLNMVTGYGEEAGAALVDHPKVRLISFTGSLEVGREVAAKCGRAMKRVGLELGSKNPVIVMPDADLDLAVEGASWGAFATSGQRCTATSKIICDSRVMEPFTRAFLERVRRMKVGPGSDPEVQIAPLINEAQKRRVLEYIQLGRREGARVLIGGEELKGEPYDRGNYVAPTVFVDVKPEMRIAREEIFGPVVCLMEASDLDEAIAMANATEYGLSASIYTRDVTNVFRAIGGLEFGVVYVNAPTVGAEVQLPFGGTKQTGGGHREAGPTALDEFTEWKAVSVDFSGRLQRAQGID